MHANPTLATVALSLDLPAAARDAGATNINAMFPYHPGDNAAALEDPHVGHGATSR
jgi:hypothetical protein